jgi:glycerate-2-kinase
MRIENLSKEIDLAAVRGGDNANAVMNQIGQQQAIFAPVTVLGGGNTNVHVNGSQNAGAWTDQLAGDSYVVGLFPFGGRQLIAG